MDRLRLEWRRDGEREPLIGITLTYATQERASEALSKALELLMADSLEAIERYAAGLEAGEFEA